MLFQKGDFQIRCRSAHRATDELVGVMGGADGPRANQYGLFFARLLRSKEQAGSDKLIRRQEPRCACVLLALNLIQPPDSLRQNTRLQISPRRADSAHQNKARNRTQFQLPKLQRGTISSKVLDELFATCGSTDHVAHPTRAKVGRANIMQSRSIRWSGKPTCAIAFSNARFQLRPYLRRALWPVVMLAASKGQTHGCTDQMLLTGRKLGSCPHMAQSGMKQPPTMS